MGEMDTFKTSLSSWAIPHSAGDSLYLHRSKHGSHAVNSWAEVKCEEKHIVGQVPASHHITGHHMTCEVTGTKGLVPLWKEDCSQFFHCICVMSQ